MKYLVLLIFLIFAGCSSSTDSKKNGDKVELTHSDISNKNTIPKKVLITSEENHSVQRFSTLKKLAITTAILKEKIITIQNHQWQELLIKATVEKKGHKLVDQSIIQIYWPNNIDKSEVDQILFLLPGWGFKVSDWATYSKVVHYANKYNICLVSLNMGVTVYEQSYYHETIPSKKWSSGTIPGGIWAGEVIPYFLMQQENLKKIPINLLGLSTGGEGVALLLLRYPWFSKGVAISGTFNLLTLPENSGEYKIHHWVYGNRSQFIHRWKQFSSYFYASEFKDKQLFFIHGEADPVVSYQQSLQLYKKLQQLSIPSKLLIIPNGKHDWKVWSENFSEIFQWLTR